MDGSSLGGSQLQFWHSMPWGRPPQQFLTNRPVTPKSRGSSYVNGHGVTFRSYYDAGMWCLGLACPGPHFEKSCADPLKGSAGNPSMAFVPCTLGEPLHADFSATDISAIRDCRNAHNNNAEASALLERVEIDQRE
jgi:hypothetical protein